MIKNVVVIGSRDYGAKNNPQFIVDGLLSDEIKATLVYWEDIELDISTGSVVATVDGVDIFQVRPDLVLSFGWYKNGRKLVYRDLAYSLALIMNSRGIEYWNHEMGNQRSTTKLSTMVQLALEGLSVPHTVFCLDVKKVIDRFDPPFIAKAVSASRGEMNFLVSDSSGVVEVEDIDRYFLIQEYLENDHDLRLVCFGGEPRLVLKRYRDVASKTHLNNTSRGGKSEWLELDSVSDEILTFASKVSRITGREMAGVDLIPNKKSPFGYSCLEVNAIPQLTSGVDVDIKIKAFVDAIRSNEKGC